MDSSGKAMRFTPPWLFGLCTTKALHTGVLTVAFPFIAARQGLPVGAIGSVIALALFAATAKILLTPVVDLVGSMRGWVAATSLLTALLTAALLLLPFRPENPWLIGAVAFAGAMASEVCGIALSGLLALTTARHRLGAASSFYAGSMLAWQGVGGGFALWSATHWGVTPTAAIIAAIILVPALAMLAVVEPERPHLQGGIGERLGNVLGELMSIVRQPASRYVLIAFLTPIGVGGASYLWSAIASEWGAGATLVSVVTGAGAALASAMGALLYGRVVDRFDRVTSFLVSGSLLVAAALLVLVLPRTPLAFGVGTMAYAMMVGFCYTSFAALQFETVGGGAAASKVAVLNAAGNLPVAYMPALLGWVHDHGSTSAMLWCEIIVSVAVIAGFARFRPRGTTARLAPPPAA